VDPKERIIGWQTLMKMVKKDFDDGISQDWGAFVGESNGYAVMEGNEVEIGIRLQQYVPFVKFKTHPVATMDQVNEVHSTFLKQLG
jgi:hypothetical protein